MAMNARLLRPLASGFNPRQIAGLAGWWDATAASSLFDAVTGGSPTAADGSVMRWEDRSGSGNHLTQPANDTADAPVRKVADVNTAGKDAVLFDGTNDVLTLANNVNTSSGGSLFIVHKRTADANGGIHAFSGVADANHHPFLGSFFDGFANGTRRFWVQAYSDALSLYAVVSGESWVAYINSLAVNTIASTTPAAQAADRPQGFGVGRYINQPNQDFNAGTYICEAMVYNRALTTAERQKVEGWLAWRWGLQAQLPYDHPYAKSFPGFGSQTVPTDADTLTYLAAVKAADGTGVEVGVANAVDAFVTGCKSDGIWDAIKASCILAGARTLAGALVPLKGTAPTNNNFVSGDYNRETGLVGNGSTKYLDSNRANNADPQDSFHTAVYLSTISDVYVAAAGPSGSGMMTLATTGARNRSGTAVSFSSTATAPSMVGHSRADSSTVSVISNGTVSSNANASNAPSSENILLPGYVYAPLYSANRLAFYSIGESLDLADLDTRVSALITAIGAAI